MSEAKERVLAVYPGAITCRQAGTTWIADSVGKWVKLSSIIDGEASAWEDAASRLRSATHTATGDSEKWDNFGQ